MRSVDVAGHLGFSKASISVAIHKLEEKGHLIMEDDGTLSLTDTGMAIAQRVYERHQVLTELLASFGVEHTVAEEDACRMEHVISQETFDVFRRMLK